MLKDKDHMVYTEGSTIKVYNKYFVLAVLAFYSDTIKTNAVY